MEFDEVIKALEQIEASATEMLAQCFNEVASVAEDENIAQLQQGQRYDGSKLPDYSAVSVRIFGKPQGAIRLYDQGDFYRGIKVSADQDGVNVFGTDVKSDMLELIYGTKIVGLSDSALAILENDYIIEEMINKSRQKMP